MFKFNSFFKKISLVTRDNRLVHFIIKSGFSIYRWEKQVSSDVRSGKSESEKDRAVTPAPGDQVRLCVSAFTIICFLIEKAVNFNLIAGRDVAHH